MTIKARKQRSDSVTAAVAMAQAKPIPVDKADKTEAQYLSDILKSKTQDSWTPNDLNIAKLLARTIKHFEQIQSQLFEQGATIQNAAGSTVLNPLQAAVTQSSSAISKLMSSIGLAASQRGTKAGELKEQWQVEAKAKGWNQPSMEINRDHPTEAPDWKAMLKEMEKDKK